MQVERLWLAGELNFRTIQNISGKHWTRDSICHSTMGQNVALNSSARNTWVTKIH